MAATGFLPELNSSSSLPVESYHLVESQRQLRAGLIACLAVAAAFVLVRLVVRLHIQRQFAFDDVLGTLAICGFAIMTGFLVHAINAGGFGRLTHELPIPILELGIKYLIFTQTTYVLTLMVNSISIALLQLRITGKVYTWFNRLHYVSIGVNIIIGFYESLTLLFQCYPIHKAWSPVVTTGHCSDKHGIVTGIFVYSVINVALTLYYALAMVPLIWKLQLRLAVKISALFVLCVGILASIATIVRFKYLLAFENKTDPLHAFVPIATWCYIELCLAISAASLATFRPLLRLLPWCKRERELAQRQCSEPEPKMGVRRGYTFQLSEIDSMGTNPDEASPPNKPARTHQEMQSSPVPVAMTPYSLEEEREMNCLGNNMLAEFEGRRDWASPDLERGGR